MRERALMVFYCSCYALNPRTPLCIISCLISMIQPTDRMFHSTDCCLVLFILQSRSFALEDVALSRIASLWPGFVTTERSSNIGFVFWDCWRCVRQATPPVRSRWGKLLADHQAGRQRLHRLLQRWGARSLAQLVRALHFIGRLRLRLIIFHFIAVWGRRSSRARSTSVALITRSRFGSLKQKASLARNGMWIDFIAQKCDP